jgi:type IV pilus assembly protein PilQ
MKASKKIFFLFLCASLCVHYKVLAESQEDNLQLAQAMPATSAALVPMLGEVDMNPVKGGMDARISLDLRNIDISEALKFLSMKAELNIITTKNVSGRVTLMVQDVAVKDIFDIMLRSNELAYTKQGNIYNVMSEDEYKALFGKKFADIRQVKAFKLKYAIPEQAFSLFDTLKSDIGRILVEPDSGTALIMDTPDNILKMEEALSVLEQKNMVQVFNLKYAKAKDLEEQLKTQLDAKKVGSVKSDERSNQLIVQTLPERMHDIESLVSSLDGKTKQVLIDTKIVKVKLSNEVTTGIEWEGLFSLGNKVGGTYLGSYPFSVLQGTTSAWQSRKSFLDSQGTVGGYPFSGNTSSQSSSSKVAPGEKMHVGMISNKQDFDVVIKYLQTLGRTQILSNPKLAVINNQEARIHVGERQAYVTTTTTTGQTTTTVSEEVTFVDVGIQLSVTPTVNDEGYVTLKVKPEVSSVVSTLTTPSGNEIPIIDTSMAETTVMIKDGATVIIGGLRKEEKVSDAQQVPFLGKIPFFGFFFKSDSNKTERTELLVMLTPHIVDGNELVTGDEREFGTKPGKEYKEYPPFAAQADFAPAKEAPQKKIEPKGLPEAEVKPYRGYSDLQEEEALKPKIKREDNDE